MSSKVFAIRDVKADYFMQPFMASNDLVAKRMFVAACSDPDTNLYQFPNDYELFEIAEFDEVTAEYTNVPKVSLGFASSYKRLDFYPVEPVTETFGE